MIQTCVILAGGLGTRLRSVVHDVPKCLAPVGDRTFLDVQIARLAAEGVQEILLSLGYLAEKVIEAIERVDHGIPVRYVVEPQLLGTGGAIAHALETCGLNEVLVCNGDTYLDGDLSALLAPLGNLGDERLRMAVVQVPDRSRFGGVEIDASGRVTGFVEKGHAGTGPINAGLYRLSRATLPAQRAGTVYSLEADVLPILTAERGVRACTIEGEFIDIGVPDDYRRFCDTRAHS